MQLTVSETYRRSDPLGLPPDDPVKPPALGLEESVEDDPNLIIDPSQPPTFDPDIDQIVTGLSTLSLTGILSGQPLTGRLRSRADRKRHLAQEPEVTIRVVPRCPDLYYEPPIKIHKAEDRWLNEIEATISRIVREIRQEVEVDEMCAKVVQEVKVTPEVKDKLNVQGTVEVRSVEPRQSSAGDRWPKVKVTEPRVPDLASNDLRHKLTPRRRGWRKKSSSDDEVTVGGPSTCVKARTRRPRISRVVRESVCC